MIKSSKKLGYDPLWYKDAIIYEVHIKSFFDSTDDGVGDLRGLVDKLDYFERLGVTVIWLLPFYPSPLRDDGYDISDYFSINKDYGSLRDFKLLLREAHGRGIRIVTELVINHTSDQHPWFQRARHSRPGSVWWDFYVWSDTPEKYKDARIIFKDFESSNWSWDPVAKAYYWHRFYSHQPDLNFDNPRVHKELFRVLDFWFGMGVDGLRLDAIPYLYEREGTNCENLQETHSFLKKLRRHVDQKFKGRMLLAEANQWPEDASAYFGEGDECHMAFHFPVMPRLFMAVQMEDRFPVVDILEQTPELPSTCQWAMFLRNHDELTLEMVTDEERDYMYRVYARDPRARINLGIRRRLAPLLNNNRRKIELMNIILFSLPGTPVLYYGDEIGMGDNYYLGDRDGVRTPMQWSSDRNAGFSNVNPQQLYLPVIIDPEYHFETINVENQERNLSSLLWWMKRVIGIRKFYKAFSRGSLEFLHPDNPKVLSFIRRYEDEIILVVINLSRFSQVAEINLSEFAGFIPRELFSQNDFPRIRNDNYLLTLGPYNHFWLQLKPEVAARPGEIKREIPVIEVEGSWEQLFSVDYASFLEREVLPPFLQNSRWFGGKARSIQSVRISADISSRSEKELGHLLFVDVKYSQGNPETYFIPMTFTRHEKAAKIVQDFPQSVVVRIRSKEGEGIIVDAMATEQFRDRLLELIGNRKKIKGTWGELIATRGKTFHTLKTDQEKFQSRLLKVEQSNSSVLYGTSYFMKIYRRIEEGINPDMEIVKFLTESTRFRNIPPFAGSLELNRKGREIIILALLQGFIQNEGDGWVHTLNSLRIYFDNILSAKKELEEFSPDLPSYLDLSLEDVPTQLQEKIGHSYIEETLLLGKRTAEMHQALASSRRDPAFEPENFSLLYQRSVYQNIRNNLKQQMNLLSRIKSRLKDEVRGDAEEILASQVDILEKLRMLNRKKFTASKIRIHGDFHLGQVLFTGKDHIIIDFEGEPARAPSERRLKYSPLRDVAGMIRSFHYASYSVLLQHSSTHPENYPFLEKWAGHWFICIAGLYLKSYLAELKTADLVPQDPADFEILLDALLLNKAIYELGYELNNRPDWVIIPIKGIQAAINNFGH
jgi:maltose alpha-D-glucosyltransferase/alpha-amylase